MGVEEETCGGLEGGGGDETLTCIFYLTLLFLVFSTTVFDRIYCISPSCA